MHKKRMGILAALTLCVSLAASTKALAIPIPMELLETRNFAIDSDWIDATRHPYGHSQTNHKANSVYVDLNGFDSALGDLTSVDIFFDSYWFVNAMVTARDSYDQWGKDASQGTATSRLGLSIDLIDPVGGSRSGYVAETARCYSKKWRPSNCRDNDYSSGYWNQSLGTDGIDLLNFTNNPLTFKLTRSISVKASSTDHDSKVIAKSDHNGWNGSVSARYHYIQHAEVAEPASIALLGIGLATMGLRRRRRSRQV